MGAIKVAWGELGKAETNKKQNLQVDTSGEEGKGAIEEAVWKYVSCLCRSDVRLLLYEYS